MKKAKRFVFLLIIVFMLAGCATGITISYKQPSEINMGPYRNVAIASTVPYGGYMGGLGYIRGIDPYASSLFIGSSFSNNDKQVVANYATDKLVSTLGKTGFFNILAPAQTDAILNLGSMGYNVSEEFLKNGYDAVMIPRIDGLGVDEYIFTTVKEKEVKNPYTGMYEKRKEYVYSITRILNISYSITVIDCKTNTVVATKSFRDTLEWTDIIDPDFFYFTTSTVYLFEDMIDDFQSDILKAFVPATVKTNVSLMGNNPKLAYVEPAYKMAKDGNIGSALDIFKSAWIEDKHVPSGYNAAIIIASYGEYDEALSILSDLMRYSNNKDIVKFYDRLLTMKKKTEAANAQIDNTAPYPAGNSSNPNGVYNHYLR